jgi:hypothetical protein
MPMKLDSSFTVACVLIPQSTPSILCGSANYPFGRSSFYQAFMSPDHFGYVD